MVTNSYIVADLIILFYYIRMISEGLCNTEDWSNDAEHSALIAFDMFKSKTVLLACSYKYLLYGKLPVVFYIIILQVFNK